MTTYLFAWNPKRCYWFDPEACSEQTGVVGYLDSRWSCGKRTHLLPGSRFFFIRLAVEPKGIIGSGITLSEPEYGLHWEDEKADEGTEALYCDIRFDYLSKDPLISLYELQEEPFSSFRWTIQAGGIAIPEPLAEALEDLWRSKTAGPSSAPPASSPATLSEGDLRKVTVNGYERNLKARAECIAHHGHRCKVCDVDLGERFGAIAEGFIHVHHIVPISSIGHDYEIDPVRDLVPVCPTCHVILHLKNPPLSLAEAKALLVGPS